jgi:general L-amino acid transport system permease protein
MAETAPGAAPGGTFWTPDRILSLAVPVLGTVAVVGGLYLLALGIDWFFTNSCRVVTAGAAKASPFWSGFWNVVSVGIKYGAMIVAPLSLVGAFSSRDPRVRAVLFQILVVVLVLGLLWYLVSNTVTNLEARQIKSGFDFLCSTYGSQIDETLIEWKTDGTYARAFIVGLLNTLKVGVIGIVLATVLGTIIGVARLSPNWLIAKIASAYVEVIRNIPLLLQLAFVYTLFINVLPDQTTPGTIVGNIIISKSGILFPTLTVETIHIVMFGLVLAGIVAAIAYNMWAKWRQDQTGNPPPRLWPTLAIVFVPAILAFLVSGMPNEWDVPKKGRFRFEGGSSISPEFLAILTGLVLYTAGFIAEIVRSGILAVSYGQTEAASALGLTRGQNLRLVILPQAMRVIIPPMTSQYLNLIKNSSLGVAIGYPELVAIANISMNQAGRALECVLIIMAVYLSVSISIALFMNWYNKKIALVERNTVVKGRKAKALAAAAAKQVS